MQSQRVELRCNGWKEKETLLAAVGELCLVKVSQENSINTHKANVYISFLFTCDL